MNLKWPVLEIFFHGSLLLPLKQRMLCVSCISNSSYPNFHNLLTEFCLIPQGINNLCLVASAEKQY